VNFSVIGILLVNIAIGEGVVLTLEQEFDRTEQLAHAAIRAAGRLAAAARALAKAAAEGDIARIRRGVERVSQEAESARHEAANASAAWSLDPEAEEQYLRAEYTEELLHTADASGFKLQLHDRAIIAYPVIIRVLASQRAVTLNRRRVTGIRPSRVVARLKAIQSRSLRGSPQTFLEILFSAYKLIAQGERSGAAISLEEIFRVLTLLPGTDYSKEDFARDLLTLDRSGVTATRSGARISLLPPTRESRYTFVCATPEGEIVRFYGITFSEEAQ
jgi:hypothetical protein